MPSRRGLRLRRGSASRHHRAAATAASGMGRRGHGGPALRIRRKSKSRRPCTSAATRVVLPEKLRPGIDDRLALPAHHTGVDEDLAFCVLGDLETNRRLEPLEQLVLVESPAREQDAVVEQVEPAPLASRTRRDGRAARSRVRTSVRRASRRVCRRSRVGPLPPVRKMGNQPFENSRGIRADTNRETVCAKAESSRPPEAVEFHHSGGWPLQARHEDLGHGRCRRLVNRAFGSGKSSTAPVTITAPRISTVSGSARVGSSGPTPRGFVTTRRYRARYRCLSDSDP